MRAPDDSVIARVLVACQVVLLVLLLTVKARWEEVRLSRRFEGHAAYASRTPRFVPVRPRRRPSRRADDSALA